MKTFGSIKDGKLRVVYGNGALPSAATQTYSAPAVLVFADDMSSYIAGLESVGASIDSDKRKAYLAGDDYLIKKAREFLASVRDVRVATKGRERAKSVYGASVSVGAALSGSPNAFRRRKILPSAKGMLTIVVGQSPSGGVSFNQMLNRGLALTALAEKLRPIRPVQLFTSASCLSTVYGSVSNLHQPIMSFVKINTQSAPLCAASLAYASIYRMTSYQALPRLAAKLMLNNWESINDTIVSRDVMQTIRGTSSFGAGWIYGKTSQIKYEQQANNDPETHKGLLHDDLRMHFGNDMLFFPHDYLDHPDSILMMNDPKAWLKMMLDRLSKAE